MNNLDLEVCLSKIKVKHEKIKLDEEIFLGLDSKEKIEQVFEENCKKFQEKIEKKAV
jgi:hypothetical protein